MNHSYFSTLFANFRLPVLVCVNKNGLPFAYMNIQAQLMFSPTHSVDSLTTGENADLGALTDILHFRIPEEADTFRQQVLHVGHLDNYAVDAVTFDGEETSVLISGNCISVEKPDDYIVLYFTRHIDDVTAIHYGNNLATIINETFIANDVDTSIQTVLALSGQQMEVSRTYVFEDISATTTSNTYEWCADGVAPAIQTLHTLKKSDYNYDIIASSRMYIAKNVADLPSPDREILQSQGIKALAIIPFFDKGKMLGYVGFDDTTKPRNWTYNEVQFLQGISGLLKSLIKRRNAEEATQRTLDVLQIISDSSDDIIYASSLEDYTLMFASLSLAESIGQTPESLIGRKCWGVLQRGQTGPCDYCPIPKIEMIPGEERSKVYVWEHQNTVSGKTYIVRDSILKWVDGQFVHVETAIDISARKEYENQLHYYASTDSMTGLLNREWGAKKLTETLNTKGTNAALCFIDIDGLKNTNDNFGHDAGDDLLMQIVRIIREHMRENELICRWGGDEFLLLLSCDTTNAIKRISEIQAALNKYNEKSGKPYNLAFSFGVVQFVNKANTNLDALVTAADGLMYQNKMVTRGKLLRRRRDD